MANPARHRFFVPEMLDGSDRFELPARVSHQISRVLRLRRSDVVTIFGGDGLEHDVEIIETNRKSVVVELRGEPRQGIVPGLPEIHLGQALLKSDRFEMVLQKATELGATSVSAVETERCVVSLPADRAQSRRDRWEKIAIEALEQSERSDLVEVKGPVKFDELLSSSQADLKLIAAERSGQILLRELVRTETRSVAVLIGPEGGYSDRELEVAEAAGFIPVSLGSTILRSETAGIAAIAMIRALAGDKQKRSESIAD